MKQRQTTTSRSAVGFVHAPFQWIPGILSAEENYSQFPANVSPLFSSKIKFAGLYLDIPLRLQSVLVNEAQDSCLMYIIVIIVIVAFSLGFSSAIDINMPWVHIMKEKNIASPCTTLL
jgi:hypothetical protein